MKISGQSKFNPTRKASLQNLIQASLPNNNSPVFIYSEDALRKNVESYKTGINSLKATARLNFSIKSNFNPEIIRRLLTFGVDGLTTVSGAELRLATTLGVCGPNIVFNGNGKTSVEIRNAISSDCLINVDSQFDFDQISDACQDVGKKANVLIRINPNIDPCVHEYNTTASGKACKFGVIQSDIELIAQQISLNKHLNLRGIHCHLGSTIDKLDPIKTCAARLKQILQRIIQYIDGNPIVNVGGGLGIKYDKSIAELPSPIDYISCFSNFDDVANVEIIFEPGRSLVGNTAILVGTVIGIKNDRILVTDMSMTECIRPALYAAHHHVSLTREATKERANLPKIC